MPFSVLGACLGRFYKRMNSADCHRIQPDAHHVKQYNNILPGHHSASTASAWDQLYCNITTISKLDHDWAHLHYYSGSPDFCALLFLDSTFTKKTHIHSQCHSHHSSIHCWNHDRQSCNSFNAVSTEPMAAISVNIAIGIIGAFQSILVDLILLLRLTLIYPYAMVGPKRFALITALPVLLKIARLINMFMFIKVLADAAQGPFGSENIAVVWATTPYLKIEWSAQLVDNIYASMAFLWAIRLRRNYRSGAASEINPRRTTFGQRLRTLFYISVSNFVFPSLLSLAQLVVVYKNVFVLTVNEIVLVNTMVAVIGVVFATVWAGSVNYRDEKTQPGVFEKALDVPFDGPGTWKVATVQPSLTLGSTAITEQTRSTRGEAIRLVDTNQTSDIFLKSSIEDSQGQGAL